MDVTRKDRVIIGFIFVPIIAPLIFAFLSFLFLDLDGGRGRFFSWIKLYMIFGIPIAYIAALVLGVPAFLLFWKRGWIGFWSVALSAGVVAMLPGLMMREAFGPQWYIQFFVTGLLGGILFWSIAIMGSSKTS